MRLSFLRPPLLGQFRRLNTKTKVAQVLVKEDENSSSFNLDLPRLNQVFLNPRVADMPVCIVSVAGAMRTGKSFLLDQMLKHLQTGHSSPDVSDGASEGFEWRGGMTRNTSGVHIWTEPFIVSRGNEELAVFLMDTQGTFDYNTTVKENMTVFALSTMTSSLLMYNLMHVIREDHLQHLQLFTEYGRLALNQSGSTPFQKLLFLVRDWHYPHDAPFGREGGKVVLDRLLETGEQQPLELKTLRNHIVSSFTDIDCYLFPYPGPKVAEDPDFNGSHDDMDPRFSKYLSEFISSSLAPYNLEPRRIAGKTVKSREMVDYFQKYLEIFNGDEIPEPKSIFNTTAEVANLHALNEAKDNYMSMMGASRNSLASQALVDIELLTKHDESMKKSIQMFNEQSKFGGDEFAKYFHNLLLEEIREKFEYFKRLNDSKIQNLFYKAKDGYLVSMEANCSKEDPLDQQELVDIHIKFAKEATRKFQNVTEDGSLKAFSEDLLTQLMREMDNKFLYYQSLNDAKIKMAVYKTFDSAMEKYSKAVEAVLEGPLSIDVTKLEYEHRDAKKIAIEFFSSSKKYGANFIDANTKCLEQDIKEKFAYYRELNASKRLGKRIFATVEHLSDNAVYRQFWRSPQQQKLLGGSLIGFIVLRMIIGS